MSVLVLVDLWVSLRSLPPKLAMVELILKVEDDIVDGVCACVYVILVLLMLLEMMDEDMVAAYIGERKESLM